MTDPRSRSNGDAPTIGDLIELWACDRFDMRHDDEAHYDGYRRLLTEDGTEVEIKATAQWIQNGYRSNEEPRRTRGRWKIWRKSHNELQENDGVYLFVIYEETDNDSLNVIHWLWMTPDRLLEITGDSWWDVNSNPRTHSKGAVYRFSWTKLVDKDQLNATLCNE